MHPLEKPAQDRNVSKTNFEFQKVVLEIQHTQSEIVPIHFSDKIMMSLHEPETEFFSIFAYIGQFV